METGTKQFGMCIADELKGCVCTVYECDYVFFRKKLWPFIYVNRTLDSSTSFFYCRLLFLGKTLQMSGFPRSVFLITMMQKNI